MHNPRLLLTGTFILLAGVAASAQESETEGSVDRSAAIRSIYSHSPALPNGVAFDISIRGLLSIAVDDPEFAVIWIQHELLLDGAESKELLNRLRAVLEDMDAEAQKSDETIGCINGVPRFYGDDIYEAFERMEDAREAIAESYFVKFKDLLQEETAKRLQLWIDKQKPNIVHMKYDHREISRQIGVEGYDRLEKICQEYYAQSLQGGN